MPKETPQKEKRLLVVSDLDGTLLTADYDFSPAREALQGLRAAAAPLVLNSSKTPAEMRRLARELETESPLVCENGGVLAFPWEGSAGEYSIETMGLPRGFILEKAHQIRARGNYRFAGFADWRPPELMAHTGLDPEAAGEAMDRHASEPILWEDGEENFLDFKEELAKHGIRILRGGRFFHLMGQTDKADGLLAVKKRYAEHFPEINWICVALGDSASDLAMLEAADIAVVVPRVSGEKLRPDADKVIHAPEPGPAGWNEVILQLLHEI